MEKNGMYNPDLKTDDLEKRAGTKNHEDLRLAIGEEKYAQLVKEGKIEDFSLQNK